MQQQDVHIVQYRSLCFQLSVQQHLRTCGKKRQLVLFGGNGLRLKMSYTFFLSVGKLMEMHGEGASHSTTDESGTKIERDSFEPPVQESV